MCSFCNSKKNTHNCYANFKAPRCNRRTPRTKRYLENDLSSYSSGNNCYCNCCCCYENEMQAAEPYCDYNATSTQAYAPTSYCDTGYSEYKNDNCS